MNFPRLSRFVAGSALVAVLATVGLGSSAAQAQGMPRGFERERAAQPVVVVPRVHQPVVAMPRVMPPVLPRVLPQVLPRPELAVRPAPVLLPRHEERFGRQIAPRMERELHREHVELRHAPVFEGRGRWGR